MLPIDTSNPYFVQFMRNTVSDSLSDSIKVWQSPKTLGVKLGTISGIIHEHIPTLVRVYFEHPYPDLKQWLVMHITDEYTKGWEEARKNVSYSNLVLPAWLGWVDGSIQHLSLPPHPQYYWNLFMTEIFVHMNDSHH